MHYNMYDLERMVREVPNKRLREAEQVRTLAALRVAPKTVQADTVVPAPRNRSPLAIPLASRILQALQG